MPRNHSAASELATFFDYSTVGELITEIVRHSLKQLIELEVSAVVGARSATSAVRICPATAWATG